MSVLIVVAHPDDEVLGVGATAAALAAHGIPVQACILSGKADARRNRPDVPELQADVYRAQEILGIGEPILGDFPNIRFNLVPHLELVQFIETAIVETQANVIFTHHPHDLNNDHLHTSLACQAAVRLFQRREDIPRLRALYFMEILSSTDWSFPGTQHPFLADTFFPIEDTLDRKIEALRAYRGVMRDFPHPRSEEILRGLAVYHGGQAGTRYAEAFQTAFRFCDDFTVGV
ncbi:MAG TPA: PIG-L family deacetylase [Anaerolineae bacterium]|nr:PIG-L family deacetylase [Anaerolineae bacterium]